MKTITLKKVATFIIMVMFSFPFVNAQPCPDDKIRVYKCTGRPGSGGCASKCVNPDRIPNNWFTFCPCNGRSVNEEADVEYFTFASSPNHSSGSPAAFLFPEPPEKDSLNIFDLNGRFVRTPASLIVRSRTSNNQ